MARTPKKFSNQRRPRAIAAEQVSITLSDGDGRALFIQVQEQLRGLIGCGVLRSGMRLPPVRALAHQIGVNQVTVAKAYRGLSELNLIEGRRGGGSFVRGASGASPAETLDAIEVRPLLAERLFELARAPGVIAFTSNYPVVETSCINEFRDCLSTALHDRLETCFQYDPPLGRIELRRQIATYLRPQSIEADADNIIVTSGAQQAIDLAVRSLVRPGTPVIMESPAYYGAINAMRGARARILEVPLQIDGMDLDRVEALLRSESARLIYTNPTFQNPTGITMSADKRRALLALARRYDAVILEDDHSPELRFKGTPVPAIRALAGGDDLVLHARGFGKVFLPGVRLGYLVIPDRLRHRLLEAKAHADLHSNSFMQEAVALFLGRQNHAEILDRLRREYGARQRLLYDSLLAGMPSGTQVSAPDGGLSLWLTLPEGADVSELYFRAVRRGVAFVAGEVFYASRSDTRSLRISFGRNHADELRDGVERLCSVVKDLLDRRGARNLVMM